MYFTFEMTVVNGQAACAVYERADERTALSAHHGAIASAMANQNVTECLFKVFDNNGNNIELPFHWKAETEE